MVDTAAAWTTAWTQAWGEMPEIGQGRKASIPTKSGGSYDYSYAALSDILAAVRPTLTKYGLALAQSVESTPTHISVETRVYHKDGWCEKFGPFLLPIQGDARAVGSAVTYARRYALAAALGVAPDEDTDASPETKKPAAKPTVKRKPADVNLHDAAWSHAIHKAGDAAEQVFLAALAAAGIKGGHRIETPEEYAKVLGELDA